MISVIANLKGGAGKSTVAFNLAVWLLRRGQPVVAYDLDPQLTLTDVAEVRRQEGYMPPLQVYHAQEPLAPHLRHHRGFVLVDAGVASMGRMQEAMGSADLVLIPVPPSQSDIWATERFLDTVRNAVPAGARTCIFLNRADTHPAIQETQDAEAALKQLPGVEFLPLRWCQRMAYRRSLSEGLGVSELEPRGKAAQEVAQLATLLFPALADSKEQLRRKPARRIAAAGA